MKGNIGFVSFRLAGTDGVSLETAKWADVLEEMGYATYYFGGELESPPERSMTVEDVGAAVRGSAGNTTNGMP